MITRVNSIPSCGDCGCAGVKINALFTAYGGNYDFCRLYLQKDSNGMPLSIISAFNGEVTVSSIHAQSGDYAAELTEFLNALGFTELIVREPLFKNRRHENIYAVCAENPEYNKNRLQYLNKDFESNKKTLLEIYSVFERAESDEIVLPPFEMWYADASHRIRHNAGVGLCEKCGAAFAHIGEANAYLAGLAVLPQCRGQGTAKEILSRLLSGGRFYKLFAFCREPLLNFYRANGFSVESPYCLYRNE